MDRQSKDLFRLEMIIRQRDITIATLEERINNQTLEIEYFRNAAMNMQVRMQQQHRPQTMGMRPQPITHRIPDNDTDEEDDNDTFFLL